jgi:signal transduction histidine kinase
MVIGTALLVLNAYIFLNRFVLRPLDTLVEASHRVSEGDFSKKIPERPTYDEVATLVNAFNLMLDKIGKHQQTLIDDVSKARQRVAHTEKRLFAAQRLSTTGTLAAGIAHEINNPLGGMINAARTIKSGTLAAEKQKEYLELIVDGLERVRTIVQKVLQFRPKALEPQPVGLRDTITRAVAFMDHRARHKGVEIRNELPEDLPQVHGDPLELQQAFLNILMNAVDACIANQGVVQVTHKVDEAWLSTLVTDNGCGMDDQELAHCMDLFYTTKDVGEGTGLGLAVAQNIVHNHGGKIEIQSEKGKGTVVSVRLPLLRASTQRMPAVSAAAPPPPG